MIKDFLENNSLIADGAMGTYYSRLSGDSVTRVELENITNPDLIVKIHKEYIDAGSKLIRTNSFAANSYILNVSDKKLVTILKKSWDNALEAVGINDIYIAANIGPVPQIDSSGDFISNDTVLNQYKLIIDTFLDMGCYIFNFETFSSLDYIKEITAYIKSKNSNAFIMLNLSIDKSGYTRKGLYIDKLKDLQKDSSIDLLGLNCGSGPTHLVKFISGLDSIYPNAGYPELIDNRTVFNSSPDYFSQVLIPHANKLKIIGGCCGTTPEFIKRISEDLSKKDIPSRQVKENKTKIVEIEKSLGRENLFIAVELDPPSKPDLNNLVKSANALKKYGIDLITVADSPSGRMRLNSITTSLKIKRETGLNVMPHICCRDRNLIALKSDILAGYSEGLRDFLVVTGDPIPQEEKDIVKKVFNCNSITLMQQLNMFNESILKESPINIGGALNLSALNLDAQLRRMNNKIEAGASFFLTQPIYDNRAIESLKKIHKDKNIKILAGILPLVTYRNAQFLNNEFPGISIPDNVIRRFSSDMNREEAEKCGISIALETVHKLKDFVDGFYFMTPFNRTSMIGEIISLI